MPRLEELRKQRAQEDDRRAREQERKKEEECRKQADRKRQQQERQEKDAERMREFKRKEADRAQRPATKIFKKGSSVERADPFEYLESKETIHLADIQFPTQLMLRREALLHSKERKKIFHNLAKRWHPDKFLQRFGSKIDADDRGEIEERVKATFQAVQSAFQKD